MAFMGPSLPSHERAGHLLPLYSGRVGLDTWGVEPANTPRMGTPRRAGTGAPFLVELVDRQFSFLSTRDADRYLMTVSRVLTLLRREPMLAAILDDFDAEVRAAVADYHAHEHHMMDELLALFRAVRPALLEAASAGIEGFDPAQLAAYEGTLVPVEHLDYPPNEEPKWDRAASRHRVSKVRFWVSSARDRIAEPGRVALLAAEQRLDALRELHEEAFRTYRTLGVTLPGVALGRLDWAVSCLAPSRSSDGAERGLAREREDIAEMLHEPTKRRMLTHAPGSETLVQARRDAELLHEEIVLALERGLWLHGALRRFVDKAKRFHGDTIDALAAPRGAKRALVAFASALAEHLFDTGIPAVHLAARAAPGDTFVQVVYLAKPTERSVATEIARGLAALAALGGLGVTQGVLLVVHGGTRALDLPREARGGGAVLALGAVGARVRAEAPKIVVSFEGGVA
jgi:hypothetical protein